MKMVGVHKLVQNKRMNNKINKHSHIFLLLILFLFACNEKQSNNKSSKIYNDTKRFSESNDFKNDEHKYKTFYNNGVLHKYKILNNQTKSNGYIIIFDSLGRLERKARYGWSKSLKGSLVEDIIYDSIRRIEYNKSMFLKTIPNAIGDTIYYCINSSKKLKLKMKYFLYNSLSYRIILKYNKKIDTISSHNNRWVSYTFNDLEKGIMNVHFKIKILVAIRDSKKVYLWSESRRILKISK